jgi:hypothetical protein
MIGTTILNLQRTGLTRDQVEALGRWQEAWFDVSQLATKADVTMTVSPPGPPSS